METFLVIDRKGIRIGENFPVEVKERVGRGKDEGRTSEHTG